MQARRKRVHFPLGLIPGSLPYAAVLVGMYWVQSAWLAMILYHLGIVLVISFHQSWDLMGRLTRGFQGGILAALLPVYLSAGVVIYFFWSSAKIEHTQLADALALYGLSPDNWLYFVVYYCFVNSTLEELFWRGFFVDEARGLGWSDVLFSGYHGLVVGLFVSPIWVGVSFIILAAGSLIWRMVARRFDGLALPWLTHLAADVGVMAAAHLLLVRSSA